MRHTSHQVRPRCAHGAPTATSIAIGRRGAAQMPPQGQTPYGLACYKEYCGFDATGFYRNAALKQDR
jgi:hypothetical protein